MTTQAPRSGLTEVDAVAEVLDRSASRIGAMLEAVDKVTRELADRARVLPDRAAELAETQAFLGWLREGGFVFLGYRAYDVRESRKKLLVSVEPGSGLGILRGSPTQPSRTFASLPPNIRARARDRKLLVLTKANRRSTVHRPTYLDYVGVRRFGPDGAVKDAKVLRSIPLLDQAALDAVRQWVFTPTLLNGVPVPVIMTVTVQFTLQ